MSIVAGKTKACEVRPPQRAAPLADAQDQRRARERDMACRRRRLPTQRLGCEVPELIGRGEVSAHDSKIAEGSEHLGVSGADPALFVDVDRLAGTVTKVLVSARN
ncbi:hypothetical protein [Rubrimonas cliftonensis]|uniref:hypothetical protein n=1 Tax=Rubrimonas cliftonensis TaxID=89524 RepID=UPI001114E27D|nr:hypothetical protein [Rubrimonas cliftonensis]